MNNQTIDNIIDQLDEYARSYGEFYGLPLDHREKMQAIIGSITNIEPKLSGIKHERMNAQSVTNWINKKSDSIVIDHVLSNGDFIHVFWREKM